MYEELDRYIEQHVEETVAELARLCRQPSVSTQGLGIREAAELMAQVLEENGVRARVLTVPGCEHPVVYGEAEGESPRTLLFYDHYDVQPAEPLELWTTPPFEPTVREATVYARGAADDKGNIVTRLAALRAVRAVRGALPVTVKFFLEGEEEIGSPHLGRYVEAYRDLFAADGCLWEGGGTNWRGEPRLILGAKGMVNVQLEARVAVRDVHSSWATVVPNAAWRLVWALASIKGPDERIRIRGFYDDVRPPTPEEEEAIARLPDETDQLRESLGLRQLVPPDAAPGQATRRHLLEPTANIAGIESGYTGEGLKTVLPAFAFAKLDFRLVPNQRPADIVAKLRAHLKEHGFEDIEVRELGPGLPAGRSPIAHPFVALVRETAREVYGEEPLVEPTMAATGPLWYFSDLLGIPTVGTGVQHADCRMHAPDENVRLTDLVRGAQHVARVLLRMQG